MNSLSHNSAAAIADRLLGEEKGMGIKVEKKAVSEASEGSVTVGFSFEAEQLTKRYSKPARIMVESTSSSGAAAAREVQAAVQHLLEWMGVVQEAPAGAAFASGEGDEPAT